MRRLHKTERWLSVWSAVVGLQRSARIEVRGEMVYSGSVLTVREGSWLPAGGCAPRGLLEVAQEQVEELAP